MVTPSNILAWEIPWTEEPDGLQSTGSQSVGHDRSDLACTHARIFFSNQSLSNGHYQSPKTKLPWHSSSSQKNENCLLLVPQDKNIGVTFNASPLPCPSCP